MPPKISHQYRKKNLAHGDHREGGAGQVGAKIGKHLLERRHHKNHDHRCHDESHDQHRDGVHQGGLDLGLHGLGFFHVNRQPVQQLVQDTCGFAGLDQVAVQVVEVERVLAKSHTQRGSGFDIVADVVEQPGHAWIGVATADNVKRLQQRHTGFHHGGQLSRENGHVLGLDGLARAHAPFFDLEGHDALAPQVGLHLVFATGTGLPPDLFAIAVPALPLKDKFLDGFCFIGCHKVVESLG